MAKKKETTSYVVTYREPKDNKIVTLTVRSIESSDLGLSFIALSDFVFKENTLIIDPSEQDLRDRFDNTRRLHLSIYTILSIEEVGKANKGLALKAKRSNILVLQPPERGPGN